MRESRVTVKIPRPLYRKIQMVIESSGFSSPTDFIVFVLRDLLGEAERKHHVTTAGIVAALKSAVGEVNPPAESTSEAPGSPAAIADETYGSPEPAADAGQEELSASDLESVKQKLRNLGYL